MIKLTKVSESANPDFKSAQWDHFICGVENPGVSLPIDYWIEGELLSEVTIGKPLTIARTTRNGIKNIGIFYSSVIQRITEISGKKIISTRNSIYALESL